MESDNMVGPAVEFVQVNKPIVVGLAVGLITIIMIVVVFRCVAERNGAKEVKKSRSRKKSKSSESDHHQAQEVPRKHIPKDQYYGQKKGGLKPHPLAAAVYKGHTNLVRSLAFEAGGKYLASCSDDGTVRVWLMKTVADNEHKYARVNIEDHDHATNVVFSPDGSAILISTNDTHRIVVYKINKSKGSITLTSTLNFELMDDSIVSLDIALNGRFIMTCSESSITLWTLKGDKLTRIDTKQAPNNSAVISKCSNFIACCGFTTDVKIWEVIMTKAGEFHELSRAMELKGHSAGVLSVCFSQDSKRAVTLSKDRTCRLWNINVSYSLNEDPRTIQIIQLDATSSIPTRLAASPDGLSIAVAIGNSLYVYSTITGELLETLDEVHNSDVSDLLYEPGGRYLVSAGGHDRFIRLWNNVPGMREQVKDLNKRLGKATGEAMKGRLVSQIKELESLISTCENNIQK